MFLRLVWGRQEEEGYPHDLRHHFCCSLLAQRNLIPPRSFNKEPTQWHLLLWNLRKCGISLTLNRFMTHTVTALFGWSFSTNFSSDCHTLCNSLVSLEVRDSSSLSFSSSAEEISSMSSCFWEMITHSSERGRQTQRQRQRWKRAGKERRGKGRGGGGEERQPLASWDPETVSFTHTCAARLCSPYKVKIY